MKPFIVAAFIGALILAACASSPNERALQSTPGFQEGYEDGCAAATDEGSDFRDRPAGDTERLQTDYDYQSGWSSGIAACRRTDSQQGQFTGENPPLVPEPGAH